MKKKNKKFKFSKLKVIRNITIIIILSIIFFTLKCNAYNNNYFYKTIVVTKGQTLWDIAKNEKKNNNYYKNDDIRIIIKKIKKLNNLNNSIIYTNQKLKIIHN